MTIKSISLITATLLLTNTYADETLAPITIVSTSKTTQSIVNTTSNVTVITADDIEEKGYQTVAQAISHEAGMIISRSGGLGQLTTIFTRGMNGGQTLVLIDGMRLNDPSTPNGAAQLETLTTSNIQQIEIIKGGVSSIWGSNASAGVINIITKEAKEGLHGSLALTYGSFNTRGVESDLSYKDKKITAQLQASKLKTDSISAQSPRSAEADAYENRNYNIKFGYKFDENNNLALSYNDIKTDMQYDESDANDENPTGDTKQKNYALAYTFKLDDYSAMFHISKGDIERHYLSLTPYSSYMSLNEASIKEYSLINKYNYNGNTAILGLEYKDIDGLFKSEYIAGTYINSDLRDTVYKNKAIFLSNIYNINKNTLLETNLRYDDFDKFDDKTTYKIGIKHNHNFLEGFTTSANYYTAYDAPSIYQLAKQSPTIDILKPSYTKGFEISASYKDLFDITYFKNEVEDSIDNIGGFFTPEYINIEGEEKFSGLELQGSYTLSSLNINLSANYTHLFTYENEDGTNLIRRAKDTLNASVDYYTENDTHFGIDAQYIGDREDVGYNPAPSYTSFSTSTGNYTVWNLNFSTEVMNNIDLTINAKNIFDKEYQSVYGYATEGRSLYAKIKYTF